jgi:hypothetical protein
MDLPSLGEFLVFAALVGALIFTFVGVILKLCGVLLLPWLIVFSPVPAAIILTIFIAGLSSIFSQ